MPSIIWLVMVVVTSMASVSFAAHPRKSERMTDRSEDVSYTTREIQREGYRCSVHSSCATIFRFRDCKQGTVTLFNTCSVNL